MKQKKGFWRRVRSIVQDADVIIEILDARFAEQTRNHELERLVVARRKKLLLVLNKADLARKNEVEKARKSLAKEYPCIVAAAAKRQGSLKLREMIRRLGGKGEIRVGICGYPNTGKSTVINLLRGKKVAPVSSTAGFTRGEKLVKIGKDVYLIDSPGIIPESEWGEFGLALVGAKNFNQLKDLEGVGEQLAAFIGAERLGRKYSFHGKPRNGEQLLEAIAISRNKLVKGGLADTKAAAAILVSDWQKGKIR